jgi:hypothetical protein
MTQGVLIESEEREEIKRKIIAYLSEAYGRTMYGACAAAGISTSEAYRWRDGDDVFKADIKKAREIGAENATDVAESVIMLALQAKDKKTARWFLETRGKGRGYVKQTQLTGAGNAPLIPQRTDPATYPTDEEALAAALERLRHRPDAG